MYSQIDDIIKTDICKCSINIFQQWRIIDLHPYPHKAEHCITTMIRWKYLFSLVLQ